MCASLPVVAASVGGIPEMVVDGQTGLLVPARDPEGMAGALLALAHDPGRRKGMGEAGRNLVASSFSLERSVNSLQDVYAEFAAPRRT
jgi:glycosyltransferase involved in cell wall biosynthesis